MVSEEEKIQFSPEHSAPEAVVWTVLQGGEWEAQEVRLQSNNKAEHMNNIDYVVCSKSTLRIMSGTSKNQPGIWTGDAALQRPCAVDQKQSALHTGSLWKP